MPTSLTDLRLMARQKADMENSSFVSDDEVDRALQDGYKKLYKLLVSKNTDLFVAEPYEFTLSSGNTVALPTGFYKLLGVDYNDGSWRELDPFMFNERNASTEALRGRRGRASKFRYRTIGSSLYITPSDDCAGDYRLWYVPTCPVLTTTEELDAESDEYRDYVINEAAIVFLAKEESDVSVLMAANAQIVMNIEKEAATRDIGRSERVQDVRGDYGGEDFFP